MNGRVLIEMNSDGMKEVCFDLYCNLCKYYKNPDDKDPCDSCLEEPMNYHSHKPVRWEAGDKGQLKSRD